MDAFDIVFGLQVDYITVLRLITLILSCEVVFVLNSGLFSLIWISKNLSIQLKYIYAVGWRYELEHTVSICSVNFISAVTSVTVHHFPGIVQTFHVYRIPQVNCWGNIANSTGIWIQLRVSTVNILHLFHCGWTIGVAQKEYTLFTKQRICRLKKICH